jgi:Tfp pilus assembly protein PilO
MNFESVITLVIQLVTIAGFVFALGKRDARLENLEKRAEEDRAKNNEQHKEFYATRDSVTAVTVELREFGRRLEKIETSLEEILSRLPVRQ